MDCGCRTAKVALVGCGTQLKYIIATVNMKPGDMLVTSGYIPRIPGILQFIILLIPLQFIVTLIYLFIVNPNEGDAYPLGALSKGTKVHCIEKMPGEGAHYVMTAGSTATILRQVDDRVIIQLPSKLQVSLSKHCMASIGKSSAIIKLINNLFCHTYLGCIQRGFQMSLNRYIYLAINQNYLLTDTCNI